MSSPGKITTIYTFGKGTRGSYSRLGHRIPPARSTSKSETVNVTTSLGTILLKLPQEIRDMILSPLLASGHPQFLRASKAMNAQGMSLISKHGIYRINIGFGRRKANCAQLTQTLADTVCNIHVCVNMRSYPSQHLEGLPEKKTLETFTRKDPGRKSCSVTFEGTCINSQMVAAEVLAFLMVFKDFGKVTLITTIDWLPGQCFSEQTLEGYRALAACSRTRCFTYAREYLESSLGFAYRLGQGHREQMVFYPHCFNRGRREYHIVEGNCKLERWVEDADGQ